MHYWLKVDKGAHIFGVSFLVYINLYNIYLLSMHWLISPDEVLLDETCRIGLCHCVIPFYYFWYKRSYQYGHVSVPDLCNKRHTFWIYTMCSFFVSSGYIVTPRNAIFFWPTIADLIKIQPLQDLRDHFSPWSTQSGMEASLYWCRYNFSLFGSLCICLVEPACSGKPSPNPWWISPYFMWPSLPALGFHSSFSGSLYDLFFSMYFSLHVFTFFLFPLHLAPVDVLDI